MRKLSTSDWSVLTRVAASLPKGSKPRRAILGGLLQVHKQASMERTLAQMRPGTSTTFSSGGVYAHVWLDTGVARTDAGRVVPNSKEWEVVISTSPDPLNLDPRGRRIGRKHFRAVEESAVTWQIDAAAKYITTMLARHRQ